MVTLGKKGWRQICFLDTKDRADRLRPLPGTVQRRCFGTWSKEQPWGSWKDWRAESEEAWRLGGGQTFLHTWTSKAKSEGREDQALCASQEETMTWTSIYLFSSLGSAVTSHMCYSSNPKLIYLFFFLIWDRKRERQAEERYHSLAIHKAALFSALVHPHGARAQTQGVRHWSGMCPLGELCLTLFLYFNAYLFFVAYGVLRFKPEASGLQVLNYLPSWRITVF